MSISHFSAGFVWIKIDGIWYVLTVRDLRYGNLKAAGGMGIDGESPLATLERELRQELAIKIIEAIMIHEFTKGRHTKHFFLVRKCEGLPDLDETRILEETKAGKKGDKLEMRWVTMEEFASRIYPGQIQPFKKALAKTAKLDEEFCSDNVGILERFCVI